MQKSEEVHEVLVKSGQNTKIKIDELMPVVYSEAASPCRRLFAAGTSQRYAADDGNCS